MQKVNTPGFIEIESSLNRTVVWYFRKNVDIVSSYRAFLHSIESELVTKLREHVRINPIKYNLKLEATYVIPNLDNSAQNRAFKTSTRELYAHSDVEGLVDRDFTRLLGEEDSYAGKYSGFSLSCIDGLLLGVYEYTPMGGFVVLRVAGMYSVPKCSCQPTKYRPSMLQVGDPSQICSTRSSASGRELFDGRTTICLFHTFNPPPTRRR